MTYSKFNDLSQLQSMDFEQKYSQKKTKNKNIAQRNNQEILVRYLILIFCQES